MIVLLRPMPKGGSGVTEDWPAWLKAMENGTIGEARTRSFLIERFWVLERSVDTEGADFLIQRRIRSQRFTDRVPPRVGVVQAKFFQSRATTQHIAKSYVVDDEGRPIEGFFALLHLDREDDASMFLLSARQIVETLQISATKKPESYVVGAAALHDDFRIDSRRLALDRIEHSIRSQNHYQSAAFLDRLHIPFRRFGEDDIEFEWALPLPNPVGRIPEMFVEHKEDLRRLTYDIEEVLETIDAILVEKDPRSALQLLGKLNEHIDGDRRLVFGGRSDFWWEDLEEALESHDRRRAQLERDRLLPAYLRLGERVRDEIAKVIDGLVEPEVSDRLEADLEYDRATMAVVRLNVSLLKPGQDGGRIETPGRIRQSAGLTAKTGRAKPADQAARNLWWQIVSHVIEERYPDPD